MYLELREYVDVYNEKVEKPEDIIEFISKSMKISTNKSYFK